LKIYRMHQEEAAINNNKAKITDGVPSREPWQPVP